MAKFKFTTITNILKPVLGAVGLGGAAYAATSLAGDMMPMFMMAAGGLILLVLVKKK